jgi:site-specific DNA recombinase
VQAAGRGSGADPGISGRTWNRPAVQRTTASIENGQADVVVLWKWSRLSRARKDWTVTLDRVESAGGRIEPAHEQVDVTTSTGRFARGMLADFAVFESERIGDTWKEAQRRRVAQGNPANGRNRFGYEYTPGNGFTPHPEESPPLVEQYRMFLAGHSKRDLVSYLNATGIKPNHGYSSVIAETWSAETITGILDNPFASGRFRYGGQVHQGIHEPLIPEGMWQEYQSRRRDRVKRSRAENTEYLLTRFIYCGICGSKAYGGRPKHKTGPRGAVTYACEQASYYQLHKGGYVKESRIMEHLLSWLETLAQEISNLANQQPTTAKPTDPTPGIRRALIKIDQKRDVLTGKMLDGLVPDDVYQQLLADLDAEKIRLTERLEDLSTTARTNEDQATADLIRDWPNMPLHAQRELLSRLIGKIVYTAQRPDLSVEIYAKWDDQA